MAKLTPEVVVRGVHTERKSFGSDRRRLVVEWIETFTAATKGAAVRAARRWISDNLGGDEVEVRWELSARTTVLDLYAPADPGLGEDDDW